MTEKEKAWEMINEFIGELDPIKRRELIESLFLNSVSDRINDYTNSKGEIEPEEEMAWINLIKDIADLFPLIADNLPTTKACGDYDNPLGIILYHASDYGQVEVDRARTMLDRSKIPSEIDSEILDRICENETFIKMSRDKKLIYIERYHPKKNLAILTQGGVLPENNLLTSTFHLFTFLQNRKTDQDSLTTKVLSILFVALATMITMCEFGKEQKIFYTMPNTVSTVYSSNLGNLWRKFQESFLETLTNEDLQKKKQLIFKGFNKDLNVLGVLRPWVSSANLICTLKIQKLLPILDRYGVIIRTAVKDAISKVRTKLKRRIHT